jgi:hypothetical protein
LLLADDADVEQALPATAPLRQQKALAQAALQAYFSGQSEAEVRERLRAISFRSPYRDLRQLLSALLKSESDPIEADVLLARIAVEASSPYANLATIIHTVSAGTSRVTPFSTLTHNQSDFAASLLGLDQRQQRLLKQSAGLRDQHNDKALLNLIVGNLDVLAHQQAQRAALATLIDYPQGHGLYSKHFGIPSEFEQKRLQALHAERNSATEDAEARWQQCADALAADRSDPDHALAAALILRHIVQMLERAYGNA